MQFRNSLLSTLYALKITKLTASLTEAPLERGQVLFEVGNPPTYVYFPGSAVLSVVTLMRDGRGVESSTIGSESGSPLLAALAAEPVQSQVFAQIAGAAVRMPSEVLRSAAAEHPRVMHLLLRHAGAISLQAEQGVACNVLHDAVSRLARWILMTQDRTGSQSLALTQEYMAIMTGVQRTTISVLANDLRNRGLVRFQRGQVEVIDRRGLEAVACECYTTIRQSFDSLTSSDAL